MPTESIKEISFKCWRLAGEKTSPVKGGLTWRPEGISTVTFKLGLGPCGRFVNELESTIDYHGVTIKQRSYLEDIEELRIQYFNLNRQNVSNMSLIIGGRDSDGNAYCFGYGNAEMMTPTKEEHEANILKASQMVKKIQELEVSAEIKEFFYKLEDVRGRIVVIR